MQVNTQTIFFSVFNQNLKMCFCSGMAFLLWRQFDALGWVSLKGLFT